MTLVKKVLFLTACLVSSQYSYALKGDTDQPIHIDSGSQSLDMEKNVLVLTDNVVITQGSIKINATKVTIVREAGKKEKIEAQGSPVQFQQMLDNGKSVQGKATQVHYDLGSEVLTLLGKAELKQFDSFIRAERITYDVKKQQLKASSGQKNRVKTVLIPTQLQEKPNHSSSLKK